MSEGTISIKKAIPIIALTWILSLVTTLAIVYFVPSAPVGTNQIADNAIITTKLADGNVTSAKILDGSIIAADMADGSVIAVKVADGAVTTAKIADGSITSNKIADNAIVTVKLADGSVTSAKILDGSVTAVDLATGAVTTIKIADGAVTSAKLAAGAIPYASVYASGLVTTNSTSLVDMPNMAVNITLDRTSYLLIMFSAVAENLDVNSRVIVAAEMGHVPISFWSWVTPQGDVYLTSTNQVVRYSAHGFNWYQPSVTAGTYTIKIEWRVNGGEGHVMTRTLVVVALPA